MVSFHSSRKLYVMQILINMITTRLNTQEHCTEYLINACSLRKKCVVLVALILAFYSVSTNMFHFSFLWFRNYVACDELYLYTVYLCVCVVL